MTRRSRFDALTRSIPTAGALLLAVLFVSPPSVAGHQPTRHPHRARGIHHHRPVHILPPPGHRVHVGKARHLPARVPRLIPRASFEVYRPYYRGRVYFAPHGHNHAVYAFPVRKATGYVYRSHFYCEGHGNRVRVSYRGPLLSLGLGF